MGETQDETQKEQGGSRGRGLFGMRRAEIERVLNDRELLLRETQGRLRAAEDRIAELERQLEEARGGIPSARPGEEADGGASIGPASLESPSSITATFVQEELGSILAAAERAARTIVERAESEAVEEVAAARHVWDGLQRQISRYAAWRSSAEPAIEAAQQRVSETQRRSLDLAEQVRESLRLLTESLGSMDSDLRQVTGLPSAPELEAPSVFERAMAGGAEDAAELEAPGEEGAPLDGGDGLARDYALEGDETHPADEPS